jgi:phage-related protein
MRTLVIRNRGRLLIRATAYEAAGGGRDSCPTLQFFAEQVNAWPSEMEKLGAVLADISENGVPVPHDGAKFKKLTDADGLYEFKSSQKGLRLICFWDDGVIICTHGFPKGSQKTPKREIERGQRMMREYFDAQTAGNLTHAPENRSTV